MSRSWVATQNIGGTGSVKDMFDELVFYYNSYLLVDDLSMRSSHGGTGIHYPPLPSGTGLRLSTIPPPGLEGSN